MLGQPENQWELVGNCILCGGPVYQYEGMGAIQWNPTDPDCLCRLTEPEEEQQIDLTIIELRERKAA